MAVARWAIATRNRRIGVALAAVMALFIAWWLASPLFIDKTVDEQFPMSANAVIPDNMSRAQVENVMAGMAMVDSDVEEAMPSAEPTVLAGGAFRDADGFHKGSGQATVYRLADGSRTLRFEDFNVTNGPDLRVLLAAHPDPAERQDVTGGGFVELGKLKGNIGNQNYDIPADLDLAAYRSVVIYCKPFQVIFSVAPLRGA